MKFFVLITVFFIVLFFMLFQSMQDTMAVKTIIGEASDQGIVGMACVAEVIRSRECDFKAFRGANASHIRSESSLTRIMAQQAWQLSRKSSYTHGATHFYSGKQPVWAKDMKVTLVYRGHTFLKKG